MVLNALAAASVALGLGMGPEEIQAGIVKFKPVGGHSDIVETGRFTILNDCYNANPVSMKAGLDVLSEASGRKAAIIGDMFELGSEERQMHHEIGAYAANKGISLFLCIGELAKECYEGAKEASGGSMDCHYYQTKEEALEEIGSLLENGDTVLVKASHGMHFEKIVAELC